MNRIPGKQPGQATGDKHAGSSNGQEFAFAARAENQPQDQNGHGVGGQMSVGAMQKGRPNDAGQAAETPWNNAVLIPMPMAEQGISQENDPAQASDCNDWHETFEHGAGLISYRQ